MAKSLADRIAGQVRHILSLKQYSDALEAGDMTMAQIEAMALERVQSGSTVQPPRQLPQAASDVRLSWAGRIVRDEGVGLFADYGDWMIGCEDLRANDPDEPARDYLVYEATIGSKRGVFIDLAYEPEKF